MKKVLPENYDEIRAVNCAALSNAQPSSGMKLLTLTKASSASDAEKQNGKELK